MSSRFVSTNTFAPTEDRGDQFGWRTEVLSDPKHQRGALKGILAEVGVADALIARELDDGTLMLIDGHLRAETMPEQELPVLVLDVNEEEADKLLLALDPLAALAGTDETALSLLIEETETESDALAILLDGLALGGGPESAPTYCDVIARREDYTRRDGSAITSRRTQRRSVQG